MFKYTTIISFLALFAGCTQLPESNQTTYISNIPYHTWPCEDLIAERSRLESEYSNGIAAQQPMKARNNDTATASSFSLKIPISATSNYSIAPEISRLKGEQKAIQNVIQLKKCEIRRE